MWGYLFVRGGEGPSENPGYAPGIIETNLINQINMIQLINTSVKVTFVFGS